MNQFSLFALKVARNLYLRKRHVGDFPASRVPMTNPTAGHTLSAAIASGKPCMIARFGSVEMNSLAQYYLSHKKRHGFMDYIRGICPIREDWQSSNHDGLYNNAGFFPQKDLAQVERFCELMLDCIPELDVLGSWLRFEELFDHMHQATKVHFCNLEPYSSTRPVWSRHLAGKKVLVVHPFTKSIARQYAEKRTLLFSNPDVLPEFDLKLIPAVQSIGGVCSEFNTWFDALDHMKAQIDATDYDICLIGCGAYGFPLAAHVKRQGKQAVHLGGALQLLFGIKGKRWTEHYGDEQSNPYHKLFNEHWIFPDESERPVLAERVENACYW